MNRHDFLVEIGVEEMPPKSLVALAEAFRDAVVAGLDSAGLSRGAALAYFTPRRLAVLVQKLLDRQPEQAPAEGIEVSHKARVVGETDGLAVGLLVNNARLCPTSVCQSYVGWLYHFQVLPAEIVPNQFINGL